MTSASDGTLEERRVFCQNWRADVVAVTKSDGTPIEYVRYSAYGEPTVYPVADLNMDGVVNSTDSGLWSDLLYSTSNASVYADSDLDFDGLDDWNSGGADGDLFYESYTANLGLSGVGRVSSAGVASRTGYAGYQFDGTLSAYHVRYRVYLPDLGRWTRRDPLGYVDGMGLYEYVASGALAQVDSSGRWLDVICPIYGVCRAVRDGMETFVEWYMRVHERRGGFFNWEVVCPDGVYMGGGYHRVDDFVQRMARFKSSGCVIRTLNMNSHHSSGRKCVYSANDHGDQVPDDDLIKALPPLAPDARVDFNMCNSCDLAEALRRANSASPGALVFCTTGENASDPQSGIDFTPVNPGATGKNCTR